MPKEIERKFKITLSEDEFLTQVVGGNTAIKNGAEHMVQAYLPGDLTYRIRIINKVKALFTIKSQSSGLTRDEFEYEIPVADARQLLKHASRAPLEKTRYKVPVGEFVWEVDFFQAELKGLAVAEIELPAEDTVFEAPAWLGEEVSYNTYYTNASIAERGHPEQAINYILSEIPLPALNGEGEVSLLVTSKGVTSPLEGDSLLFRLHHEHKVSKFYIDLLTCNGYTSRRFFEVSISKSLNGFQADLEKIDKGHPAFDKLAPLAKSIVQKHGDDLDASRLYLLSI